MNRRGYIFTPWLLAGILSTLFAVGCSSVKSPVIAYSGPELPADQVARIEVQEGLQVLGVDDQRYKAPYIPDTGYQVHVKPGSHVISVFYNEMWGDATDASPFASDMYHFRLDFKAGQTYYIQHNAPANKMEPMDFPLDFTIWMKDPTEADKIQAASTSKYGTFVSRGLYGLAGVDTSGDLPPKEKKSDADSQTTQPADAGQTEATSSDDVSVATGVAASGAAGAAAGAATGAAVAGAASADSPSKRAAESAGDGGRHITILDEMKAVWEEATEEDKTAFRKWIIDNP